MVSSGRRVEPGRDGEQALQAAQQQPRAHEQDERERDFRDDERATGRKVAAGGAARASRRPPCRSLRDACSAGTSPTPKPTSVVTPSAKANTAPSSRSRPPAAARRAERDERPHAEQRPRHPERPAERGEQQALREQLPHESRAPGAERGAHGELAAPFARRARAAGSSRSRRRSAAAAATAPRTASSAGFTLRVTSSCSESTISPAVSAAQAAGRTPRRGCARSRASSRVGLVDTDVGRSRPTMRRWWPHSRPWAGSDGSYRSGAQSSAAGASTFSNPPA